MYQLRMKRTLVSVSLIVALLTIVIFAVELKNTRYKMEHDHFTSGFALPNSSTATNANSIVKADSYRSLPESKMSGIDVGKSPKHISVNPNTNMIYVTNEGSNTISIIDGRTNTLIRNVQMGLFKPLGIAVNSKTNLVYISLEKDIMRQISVLNGSTGKVVANFTVNYAGEDIAVDDNTNMVYVPFSDKAISIINGSSNRSDRNITGLACCIDHIAVNPSTNMIYVTNPDARVVSIIDGKTNKPLGNQRVASDPDDIAVNPSTNMIYINNNQANRLSILNGSSNNILKTVVMGNYSEQSSFLSSNSVISVNPKTNVVYVTNNKLGTVSIMDGSSDIVMKTIVVDRSVSSIAVNPKTNVVYVTNADSGKVSVIDGNNNSILIGHSSSNQFSDNSNGVLGINVGSAPSDIAVNPNTNKIYVTYELSNKLSVIDGNTDKLLTTLSVGGKPDKPSDKIPIRPSLLRPGVAVDYNTNTVYMTSFYSNQVFLIDGFTNSIIGNVTVGRYPVAVAVDPSEHKVYVAAHDGNLTVIDSFQGSVVNKASLSEGLMDVTADPNAHQAYAFGRDGKLYILSRYGHNSNATVHADILSIAVNPKTQLVYMASNGGSPLLVFDHYTNSIVANITIGSSNDIPDVTVNPNTNMVYVKNMRSNTVSVINGSSNSIVANITLGEHTQDSSPIYGSSAIAVNPTTNLVYVTDTQSNVVHAINGKTNNPTAEVNFNVNPPNTGIIECNDMKISNNYTRYDIGTKLKCTAEAKKQSIFGFKPIDNVLWRIHAIFFGGTVFSSWSGNVVSDSNDPTIRFGVNKYGITQTANFTDVPPRIPQAYMTTILTIAIPAIGAWLYKNRAQFSKRRSKGPSYQDKYMKIIDTIYSGSSIQNVKERLKQLADIRTELKDLYVQGTINDIDYKTLNDKISNYVDKIYNGSAAS